MDIPSGLIQHALSAALKSQLRFSAVPMAVSLTWDDVLPHTADRVRWELWSNSNDECGVKCDLQRKFIADFAARTPPRPLRRRRRSSIATAAAAAPAPRPFAPSAPRRRRRRLTGARCRAHALRAAAAGAGHG